ncbi:MAG TPA: ferritin-like domain-containing protein [Anaerolineae bacterium]|nr:ferritin-like domain-containing protein [Anaerolineae bacterium]
MAKLENLRDLTVDQLKDLYSAENQLLKALPRMVKAATSPELKEAFETHLQETEEHVNRLDVIAKRLGVSLKGKKCKGMAGLIEEGKEMLQQKADAQVMDAGLIAAAQRAEHYEIAGYGTARAYAELIGDSEAADLLQKTLNEEEQTDERLTLIAENSINIMATSGYKDVGAPAL